MKNLENEYRNQIDSEVPDLWARIEAGVDAIEASKKETEAPAETKKENITFFNKYKNTFTKVIVAAACVTFVVVAVKGGVIRNFGGSKSAATETAMAETEMEATESAAESSYYDNSMSEAAANDSTAAGLSEEAASPSVEANTEQMLNAETSSDASSKSSKDSTAEAGATKDGEKEIIGIKIPPALSKDEEEALTTALKDLDYKNISKLQAEELSEVDITTAHDLLPANKEGFMASFVNNDNNQKCIVLYSFDTVELTVEIYMIKPANADDTVLYLK